jgi:hypothetical protein
MSRTSEYKYQNDVELAEGTRLYEMALMSNYGYDIINGGKELEMNNKTAPFGAEEIITLFSREIPKVDTKLSLANPTKAKGAFYGVKYEAVLQTTDDSDPTFEQDEAVVVNINVRHPKSSNWTADKVDIAVRRALSTLYYVHDASSSGTGTIMNRFSDLMRGQELPVDDVTHAG